ncbi:hypothetical protein POM88_030962 [Heracleum sosnowskyi]|uniref:Uncharacterized protein n=1 Tax=Heracleum sosnowskyi TaxID=360622 RepID=A0AAD8HWH6_9APIA|nr:hypothetical protein POM88_030962 [Heracleum sosnowskyi]
MYLVWEGGDWGTLFRRSFSRVSDGSPGNIILNDEEAHAYAELTKDDYATMAWMLLDEFQLKSLGLSNVSDKAFNCHEIGGAGLDVYENEPKVLEELFGLNNVVLSSHTDIRTPEYMAALKGVIVGNLEAFFANKPLLSEIVID